jgi:hypothetical protein
MKKYSVLWLLPLVAVLFIGLPSDLSARETKKQKQAREAAEAAAAASMQAAPSPFGAPLPTVPPVPEQMTVNDRGGSAVGSPNSILNVEGTKNASRTNPSIPREVPDWVWNRDMLKETLPDIDLDTVYIGIGSAKNDSSDLEAIQIAEARARQDIAFQQGVLVKAAITDYAKNVSTGNSKSDIHNAEDELIARQSINTELSPVTVVHRELSRDGTWWVIATYSKEPESRIVTTEEKLYTGKDMQDAVNRLEQSLERNRLNRR